jgi:uncharacterized protein (TIGR02246 family)
MPKDDLSDKNLDHISLSGADMAQKDLSKSSLRRAQLRGANLKGANLQGSDLHGAHLEEADVTGADLSGADLTGASLDGVDIDQAASIEGAHFDDVQGVPGAQPLPEESDTGVVRWDVGTHGPDLQPYRRVIPDDEVAEIAYQVLSQLEAAWNTAHGRAFDALFAADATFVTVHGEHHQGRDAIAHGHQAIFETIYQEGHQSYDLIQAQPIDSDVILVLARCNLNAPTGPMAGESHFMATLVLVRQETEWQIAALHNTLVTPSR